MNLRDSIKRKLRTEDSGTTSPKTCYRLEHGDNCIKCPSSECNKKTTPCKYRTPQCKDPKPRTKEQTTASAAGAYTAPLFGKPMKRKITQETYIGGDCECDESQGGDPLSGICTGSCKGQYCDSNMPCEKPKSNKTKNIKIKESELISLIEKSIYSAQHGGVIKEALTDADERRIGVLARKELKDYEVKLEKKVDQMIIKAFKGKDFEDKTLKITRNALIQLYKALWIRRSFWSDYIKNTPS